MESEQLTPELTDQDRVLLVFDYLGPLAIVSLVASRREFVKWHAKQGMLLFAAIAAMYFAVIKPINRFLRWFLWGYLHELFWACATLVVVGAGVLALLCIVRALDGERFKIPMLGELADRL